MLLVLSTARSAMLVAVFHLADRPLVELAAQHPLLHLDLDLGLDRFCLLLAVPICYILASRHLSIIDAE